MVELNSPPEGAIAIIGMAGRFPGAANLEQFWQNLRRGTESIHWFSEVELMAAGVSPAVFCQPNYVPAGGALTGIGEFAASFFGFSPREAALIDPQQRWLLEVAWEALEQAGYDPQTYPGAIGVYAGSSVNTYFLQHLYPNRELLQLVGGDALRLASRPDNLATRIAYKLNLRGPSLSVQTGCSTSLVAVHLACQSLLQGECDLALAGGASISATAQQGYVYQPGGILSPDGHCRAFDAEAAGTVNGNGVGLVVLKRLEEAIADRDGIQAVIRGSAINNDGAAKVGYTAPSVSGQAAVIAEALAVAGVEPATIDYIETHGTGTHLGDPIEIAALKQVFTGWDNGSHRCAIGSVKTNIGHLDVAAGIAGLIKTTLALQHQELPPSLHFQTPNPEIDLAQSPFTVNASLSPWPTAENHPQRAGVSSFGIGGTNAHVILEAASQQQSQPSIRPWQLLLLSARTPTALEQATANLTTTLIQQPELNLADVAYTLQVGRRPWEYRRMLVCRNSAEAVTMLQSRDGLRPVGDHRQGVEIQEVLEGDRSLAFLFPGQGAQYPQMGRELYSVEPLFRQQVDRCCEQLQPLLALDLRSLIFPDPATPEAAERLQQTALAQPALFVIEYALAQLWLSWGVQPSALLGHSIGEYVAACLAGIFPLEAALKLVATRARLMQQLPAGAMLAIALPEAAVQELLGTELDLAACNAPDLCVVSGPVEEIAALQQTLTTQGHPWRRLHTSHAFHSRSMDPILKTLRAEVEQIALQPPQIPLISSVTGTWLTPELATDPRYWAHHLRQTVRFSEGVQTLLANDHRLLLEVGPGRNLSSLVQKQADSQTLVLPSLPHPQEARWSPTDRRSSPVACLLQSLGQLWLQGVSVDWLAYWASEPRQRLPLPTYPFERDRYWIELPLPGSPSTPELPPPEVESGPKLDPQDWFSVPVWQQAPRLDSQTPPIRRWLVFAAEDDLSATLVLRLQAASQPVTVVRLGEEFAQLHPTTYTVNPHQPADYVTLLQTLEQQGNPPDAIAHAWSLSLALASLPLTERVNQAQERGFYSLLFLAQALGQQALAPRLPLIVLSQDWHDITGTEVLRPEQATLVGPCRVIPQEYPAIACHSIDLPTTPTPAAQRQLLDQLVPELLHLGSTQADSQPQWIALRGGHRWVQTLSPVALPPVATDLPRLRSRGVYLITGGLGGIGLALAEELARSVQARLVLVGRSPLPDRQTWSDWLASHPPEDRTSQILRQLQALETLGAEVMVCQADVTCLAAMQQVKARVEDQWGPIQGVIHAAGVAGGGMIQLKTAATVAEVLAPKLTGTLVLAELFQAQPLDFLVLCSSLSAILGGFGQVDYAAANAFLDSFAQAQQRQTGLRAIAINWCAWQQVGMAAATVVPEAIQAQRQASLQSALQPQEGQEVFQQILHSGLPQVLVSTQNLDLRRRQMTHAALAAKLQTKLQTKPQTEIVASVHARPALAQAYIAPRNDLEQQLAQLWQQLLGIEQVGIYDHFLDLGGHSLLATQLLAQIQQQFQVDLPLNRLFEQPTIAALANQIETMLIEEIATLSEAEAEQLLQESLS